MVGWSGDQTTDTPDILDITLDKASYRAGDTLQARLAPRFAGKATLAVVSDKVHDMQVVDLSITHIFRRGEDALRGRDWACFLVGHQVTCG